MCSHVLVRTGDAWQACNVRTFFGAVGSDIVRQGRCGQSGRCPFGLVPTWRYLAGTTCIVRTLYVLMRYGRYRELLYVVSLSGTSGQVCLVWVRYGQVRFDLLLFGTVFIKG